MRVPLSFALITALAVAGCSSGPPAPNPVPVEVSKAEVQAYARAMLNDLNVASYTQQREFCGYFYRDATGAIRHTAPKPGTADFCDYGPAPETTVASFHTHGHYLPGYDSEIPSYDDALGSLQIGFDDYLVTPGGRFWIVGADGQSRLLCDVGCLNSDPNHREDPALPVDNAYSARDLQTL